ncbi:Uma2 family endonuclease [Streptomyces sp. NPDC091281]|uniref:Uma2 family endonuclease n=1 Tax=Streptomyces sp. NPDC091281 TaxID=3365985 RepID=UPI00380ECCB2
MEYPRMRAIAEELGAYAEGLDGAWRVEVGPAGPVLAMSRRPKRHAGTLHRLRALLDGQLARTHPGHRCLSGPLIEHPGVGRLYRPDAIALPEAALDEDGLAADSTTALAVLTVIPPSGPDHPGSDYAALGVPRHLIADPRTGTVDVHSAPRHGRYARKESYIYGEDVPFGPWTVATADFRRYGKAGDRTA